MTEFKTETSPLMGAANEQLRREYEGRKEDISIPRSLGERIIEGINFSLETGAAKEVSGYDLYHVHVCIPSEQNQLKSPDHGGYKDDPQQVIEKVAENPDTVLLFHTQEFVHKPTKRRNVVLQGNGQAGRLYLVLKEQKELSHMT